MPGLVQSDYSEADFASAGGCISGPGAVEVVQRPSYLYMSDLATADNGLPDKIGNRCCGILRISIARA